MRRFCTVFLLLAAFTGATFADEAKTPQARVAERQAAIARMKEQYRAEALAKLALDLAELAFEQYKAGDLDAGNKTIAQVSQAAEQSVTSARIKKKKIKEAEINLRRCGLRLDDVRRSLSVADQPPVKQAMATIEKARGDLLEAMFAK